MTSPFDKFVDTMARIEFVEGLYVVTLGKHERASFGDWGKVAEIVTPATS
jgi:hypothetical protein